MKKILVSYLVNGMHNNSMKFDFLTSKHTNNDEVRSEAKKRAALRENKPLECITLNPFQSINL
ncbi:hypothetical protein [Carboxylicivirga linearis]|uniref:Uncharacterized protein n=1 Tax=Carboxylicivirga linearis TaxID=1628157 RepID=A0ABS5K1I8_9BACT|nr:hypothetical protein [Carboxylicivirga linearis]MBS2100406.1 hypothetical protein [Carboxylicivirga linearis]